jgi:hypothetical protein
MIGLMFYVLTFAFALTAKQVCLAIPAFGLFFNPATGSRFRT